MINEQSKWPLFLDWLQEATADLTTEWPEELPPEDGEHGGDFWFTACRYEMTTRDRLSEKIRLLVEGRERCPMSPLESWLFRRRVDWAAQVAVMKIDQGVEPPVPLEEMLLWGLVRSWESDGCIGMWNHAERGGKAHPGNPDGMSISPPEEE